MLEVIQVWSIWGDDSFADTCKKGKRMKAWRDQKGSEIQAPLPKGTKKINQ